MQNARLDEAQARIQIARRNVGQNKKALKLEPHQVQSWTWKDERMNKLSYVLCFNIP